jgi:hypothetical protein
VNECGAGLRPRGPIGSPESCPCNTEKAQKAGFWGTDGFRSRSWGSEKARGADTKGTDSPDIGLYKGGNADRGIGAVFGLETRR